MKKLGLRGAAALLALAAGSTSAATLVLNNVDAPGVGFNDPTPATPVGGNMGTTVGQQRLIAYSKALELWGKTLKSDARIVVRGSFARLNCTAAGGTLAQAGAVQIFSDFPGAPLAGHWYGAALASTIAGQDLSPGPDDVDANGINDEIVANFNGDVGKPDCIAGPGWYYGLDNNAGAQTDFLDTFMHEVAHGLGFQNFVSEATGNLIAGLPDVYMANTLDLTTGKKWNAMTTPEIVASAVRNNQVVWDGAVVTAAAVRVLGPYEGLRVQLNATTKELEFGTASFGPLLNPTNFSGQIVLATDDQAAPGGGTVTDGCEPITANVAGRIALVDRGLCSFAVKTKNAQNAGAVGVIIANTLGRTAFGMSGTDATITIPTAGISNADGDAIKAALPTAFAEYYLDASRRAGTTDGYVRLYAPTTVVPGSTLSHFDVSAAPNLLMEPSITPDLKSARNLDLTPSLMRDIGWQLEGFRAGTCSTTVPSTLADGQMLHADLSACIAGSGGTKGKAVNCMAKVTDKAVLAGLLTATQKNAVMTCVGSGLR